MIIWINGPFGVGKTQVARRIAGAGTGAFLFDPEQIGFLLRRLLPGPAPIDFQDLPLWRELTIRLLREAAATASGPVVVPMTLTDPRYFDEIAAGVRAAGLDLRHFTLLASADVVRQRLRRRLDWPASRRWALERVEPCLAALAAPMFQVHVHTERRAPADIAGEIMALLPRTTDHPGLSSVVSSGTC